MIRCQRLAARPAAVTRAVLAAGCIASGGVGTASAAPLYDAVGDALCVRSVGFCSVSYDITQINAVAAGGNIIFRADLNQNIVQIPSQDPFSPSQFGGYIDIDTDQNQSTGTPAWGDYFGETAPWPDPAPKVSGLGDEYYIDLYQEAAHAGFVEVYDGAGASLQGLAPIAYGPNWFEITVALTLLGGDDGLLNYDVVVGDGTGLTDQAVDYQAVQAGDPPGTSSLPEPSSAALFGLILVTIGLVRRRVRAT